MIHVKFLIALAIVLSLMFGTYMAGMAYLSPIAIGFFKVVLGIQLFGIVWFVANWIEHWAGEYQITGKLA